MQKKYKHLLGILAISTFAVIFAASFPAQQSTRTVHYSPGWYGITAGWNNGVSDIDGQVGYSLYVSNPRGRCETSGQWTCSAEIVSGSLPPGLQLNDAPYTITGIPTERGHWIVQMKISNIMCNGSYYQDFNQELRFHITGSGRVNN
jgi:hypothetical protein